MTTSNTVVTGTTNVFVDAKVKKIYTARADALLEILNASPTNWDKFEEGTHKLIKDFPTGLRGYADIMLLAELYEDRNPEKARQLANEIVVGAAPQKYKLWAKGMIERLDSKSKPISLQFTAVDGREVDLAKMKGKVVLVDFWATTCSPCVAELPQIKAAYEKLHNQGFDVIGISCDTDQKRLQEFVKRKDLPWPQYYDGKQQTENKYAQGFGIDGIPHLLLVDRKGILRADDVQVNGSFEGQITKLLEEKSEP